MAYKHETTRRHESTACEGVIFYVFKMTEGRRIDLRKQVAAYNARVREILREQAEIDKLPEDIRDAAKYAELNDEFDGIMVEGINPTYVTWGVKKIEGLEVDGKPLDVGDWKEFPSVLFDELLRVVKEEAELNGAEIKDSLLRPTSSSLVAQSQTPSAESASVEDSSEAGTVVSISRPI